jgi:predicted PurR-regulated permease PerM
VAVLDARTGRVLLTIGVVVGALAFVYAARHMLIAFLFAIFFAYLVDPLVSRVQPWVKGSRGRAIAVVYAGFVVVLGIFFWLLGARLSGEASRLGQQLPDLYHRFASGQIVWTVGQQRGWSETTMRRIQEFLASHQQEILTWLQHFGARAGSAVKNAWYLILIPILGVFFLKDGRNFADAALDLLRRRQQREFLDAVLRDVNEMLAHFIRAQLILAVLSGVAYTIALLAMRMPFAVVLAVVGGILEFVPVVGPLAAAVIMVAIALFTGYKHVLLLILFLLAWRGVQDYVNAPRIMGKSTELHPLAALFGVLVGAEVAGVIGVYLSIPIMATLRIVWRHWRAYMDQSAPKLATPFPSSRP